MKATIGHIGINLSNSEESFEFWKALLQYLEFVFLEEGGGHFDATDGEQYICITATDNLYIDQGFHRKRTGLNHIAFKVASQTDVDRFVSEFLNPQGIKSLYNGANEYPEYVDGYYAVYFEDPDRIKVEVVYDPT